MTDTYMAKVFLWGTCIGAVTQSTLLEMPKFNYDKAFINSGIEVSPIVMPLSEQIYSFPALRNETFHGLPGLLADSLPDKFGNKLIEHYLSKQKRRMNSFSAVERLLYTGERGMGALEYKPPKDYAKTESGPIDLDALLRLSSDILSERENLHLTENELIMEQLLNVGTSAGGARAKALVAMNPRTKEFRSGQINAGEGYEYWLIKFDGVANNKDKGDKADGEVFTRIEYAYYLMAIKAGIVMEKCQLERRNGLFHFMTKRFDRTDGGDKLHMQSLGAIAHYDFNLPGEYSYEDAAGAMQKLGLPQSDKEQLFRRMVFNITAQNRDDHVKNISFLMNRNGVWSLAPAYDITYAYDAQNAWLSKHQMLVNGKADSFTRKDIIECAMRMNISKPRANQIIHEVIEAVQQWALAADEAFIPKAEADYIQKKFIFF